MSNRINESALLFQLKPSALKQLGFFSTFIPDLLNLYLPPPLHPIFPYKVTYLEIFQCHFFLPTCIS